MLFFISPKKLNSGQYLHIGYASSFVISASTSLYHPISPNETKKKQFKSNF